MDSRYDFGDDINIWDDVELEVHREIVEPRKITEKKSVSLNLNVDKQIDNFIKNWNSDSYIEIDDLYMLYVNYCKENNQPCLFQKSNRLLGKKLAPYVKNQIILRRKKTNIVCYAKPTNTKSAMSVKLSGKKGSDLMKIRIQTRIRISKNLLKRKYAEKQNCQHGFLKKRLRLSL